MNVSEKQRSLPGWEGCEHSTLVECYTSTTTIISEKFTSVSMPPSLSVRQHEPMVSSQRRRGVFPGSFNPLTIAHLEIARCAREEHGLDEVHLVVSTVALDKPAPPGPSFEARIALLEADAADVDWLFVGTTAKQLIVDIAEGYDIVIMGADKWHQVNDDSYYRSTHERDAALARLPQVAVAPRDGLAAPEALTMQTPTELQGVSSTLARRGRRELMAPHAAANWKDAQVLATEQAETTEETDEEPRP